MCVFRSFFSFLAPRQTVSRVLSKDDHLSWPDVAEQAHAITRSVAGRYLLLPHQSCTERGLQGARVASCPGELLPRLSTLTAKQAAVYFCCTFLGVASTGRYPASCPVKPGLSSPAAFRRLQLRLLVLLALVTIS